MPKEQAKQRNKQRKLQRQAKQLTQCININRTTSNTSTAATQQRSTAATK